MRFFTQSATLLFSFLFVLIVISTPLSEYMSQILAAIIALSVLFVILMRRAKKHNDLFIGSTYEVATVTIAIMLAIFITGGLESGLYFLLYFLLFGIVFLFEPASVFIMLIGILTVFFGQAGDESNLVPNLVKLGSLVFLSPIAYFFGREFAKRQELKNEVQDATGQILEDADAILRNNSNLTQQETEELDDIIERTNELRQKVQEDN